LRPEFIESAGLRDRWQWHIDPPRVAHPRNPEAYRLLEEVIWPVTFEECAPSATRRHLEMRHPLLDIRLARFCLALPVKPWMEKKGLLKIAMRDALPQPVLQRPKTPLEGNPIELTVARNPQILFRRKLHPAVHEFVDTTRLPSRPEELHSFDPMDDIRVWSLSEWLWQEAKLKTEEEDKGRAA
jgi:asparagine synthase (glutamine-hydrolysing)